MREKIIGTVLGIIIIAFLYFASWILTCGIIKLITLCFGIGFSWLIATGIWLIMCIAKDILKRN